MPKQSEPQVLLSGRYFNAQELFEIQETIRLFPELSRTELAKTICENLGWVTPVGRYKTSSCQQLLEKLEGQGLIALPPKRECQIDNKKGGIILGSTTAPAPLVEGRVTDFEPIELEPARSRDDLRLWNEYVHRYHALGYKRPFGAHQRYFIVSGAQQKLGCLLFAAAAWALQARDEWIGWTEVDRSLRLNLIVNNTRFLIFPWVRVKNLASRTLSLVAKRIGGDWQERYGYRPVLLETFVDPGKYRGTCYKAANWIFLGQTKGRGRTERHNKRPFTRKHIYVYPLCRDFRSILCGKGRDFP
ncbi:MAG: hypothetical protein AVO34_05030 [Firmicutes bacterium ML8_F2]|jgi:hypothetical protein|nr:MAG: hypothetical protein AVO34_05030 [Firmicutes bacterium ML8_F2]